MRILVAEDRFADFPIRVRKVRDEPQTIRAGAIVSHLEPTLMVEPESRKSQKNGSSVGLDDVDSTM